jgi:hypothetical protein
MPVMRMATPVQVAEGLHFAGVGIGERLAGQEGDVAAARQLPALLAQFSMFPFASSGISAVRSFAKAALARSGSRLVSSSV